MLQQAETEAAAASAAAACWCRAFAPRHIFVMLWVNLTVPPGLDSAWKLVAL